MELIKNLFDFFNDKEKVDAQFANSDSATTRLLFVTPTLTADSFYRIILPFAYLSEFMPVQTSMLGMMTHNPTQLYEKRVTIPLTSKKIQWANAIYFPFTTQELKPLYKQIRTLNKNIRIIYNVDQNIFHLPESHPLKRMITDEMIKNIDDNILYSDLTLVPNQEMHQYLLTKHFENHAPMDEGVEAGSVLPYPFLTHYPALYEDQQPQQNDTGKIRLAIPVNDGQYEELALFNSALGKISSELKDAVDIIILGGRISDQAFVEATKDVVFEHIPAHPEVEDYYSHILSSKADVFLYLSQDKFFNKTSDDPKKIMDFGIVGCPCVIPACSPMAEIVRPIGWVLENNDSLFDVIEQISQHPQLIQDHAVQTFNKMVGEYSFDNSRAINKLDGVF